MYHFLGFDFQDFVKPRHWDTLCKVDILYTVTWVMRSANKLFIVFSFFQYWKGRSAAERDIIENKRVTNILIGISYLLFEHYIIEAYDNMIYDNSSNSDQSFSGPPPPRLEWRIHYGIRFLIIEAIPIIRFLDLPQTHAKSRI